MNVRDVLKSAEAFIDKTVEIEGILISDNAQSSDWFVSPSQLLDLREAIIINRPPQQTDKIPSVRDLTEELNIQSGLFERQEYPYIIRGYIKVIGRLVEADSETNSYLLNDIQKLAFNRLNVPDAKLYVQRNITFDDVEIAAEETITVPEAMSNFDRYRGRVVQLEGYLRGQDKPEELCYLVSHQDSWKEADQINESILINQKGIIGRVLRHRLGGRFQYYAQAQVVGKLAKSDKQGFIAALDHVTKLASRKNDSSIWVHTFSH